MAARGPGTVKKISTTAAGTGVTVEYGDGQTPDPKIYTGVEDPFLRRFESALGPGKSVTVTETGTPAVITQVDATNP